jgi:hypothetical protein
MSIVTIAGSGRDNPLDKSYSNAPRGKIRKAGADPSYPPIIEVDPSYVPAKGWAEMIRRVYEVDPLLCPPVGAG